MHTHRSKLGALRTYGLAITVFMSGFLQGYDAGVGGGILTFKSFQRDFGYPNALKTEVTSLSVGLQNVGAFIACPLIYPIQDHFGRKLAIFLSLAFVLIGGVVQVNNTGNLAGWYVARVIGGMGLGGLTVVTPTYSAEMAPKDIRGRLGSMYQMMYTIGIFLAYWVNYAVERHVSNTSSKQWQISIGLELVWAGIFLFGMIFLPESVRWYLKKDRNEEAWKALSWVRGDSSEITVSEFEDMKHGIELENAAKAGFRVRELLEPVNRKRLTIGTLIFLFQQGTGSGALASYGPQFFTLLVGSGSADILLTGFFGAVKVIACAFFILFLSERFGRRTFLVGGSLGMFACMLPLALVLKFRPAPGGTITSSGGATIALLYINIAIYNWSWGPIPWAYVPEVFPTRYRGIGMAISVSTHWAFSCCFSLATPYMIRKIGWGTFLFFAIFDMVNAIGAWLLVHETRGKTLEYVDHEFKANMIGENAVQREEAAADRDLSSRGGIGEKDRSREPQVLSKASSGGS